MKPMKKILSPKEVLDLLGVCQATLYRYRKDGKLKPVRINARNFRYQASDVAALLGVKVEDILTEEAAI